MRPSGNSIASWCVAGLSLLICRKMAVRWEVVAVSKRKSPYERTLILSEKAHSVPGNRQMVDSRSSKAAKPRVPVPKLCVINLAPTEAGRERTLCRLKSHICGPPLLYRNAKEKIAGERRVPKPGIIFV